MRNYILNYNFKSSNIEEGDITEEYNELYLFLDHSKFPADLLQFAQENDIPELYIRIDCNEGTFCLCDDTGFNCDNGYSSNYPTLDLDNLDAIEELLMNENLDFFEGCKEDYN
jgi:hypothetical protein